MSLTQILPRELLQRACTKILQLQGAFEAIFLRDLLHRSSVESSYRHLAQIALQRDLAQKLLQRTCQGDLAHDLLAESKLVSLLHVPCNTVWGLAWIICSEVWNLTSFHELKLQISQLKWPKKKSMIPHFEPRLYPRSLLAYPLKFRSKIAIS